MKLNEKIRGLLKEKYGTALVVFLGTAGLLLILISSFLPKSKTNAAKQSVPECSISDYCPETERKLEDFLRQIDGAGKVRVYLTIGSGEQYVYAKEEKQSRSENKTEEEDKYVIIGGGSEKNALIETVLTPEITGAVIACTGCDNPTVTERIYRAASAALGIPTSKIYVTKLEKQ